MLISISSNIKSYANNNNPYISYNYMISGKHKVICKQQWIGSNATRSGGSFGMGQKIPFSSWSRKQSSIWVETTNSRKCICRRRKWLAPSYGFFPSQQSECMKCFWGFSGVIAETLYLPSLKQIASIHFRVWYCVLSHSLNISLFID